MTLYCLVGGFQCSLEMFVSRYYIAWCPNPEYHNIVTCISDYRQGLERMIGFINTLYNQYSAIADLHNLQFIVTHALGFSVFTSHILVMELKPSHCDLIF
jgi:hypothetical protein